MFAHPSSCVSNDALNPSTIALPGLNPRSTKRRAEHTAPTRVLRPVTTQRGQSILLKYNSTINNSCTSLDVEGVAAVIRWSFVDVCNLMHKIMIFPNFLAWLATALNMVQTFSFHVPSIMGIPKIFVDVGMPAIRAGLPHAKTSCLHDVRNATGIIPKYLHCGWLTLYAFFVKNTVYWTQRSKFAQHVASGSLTWGNTGVVVLPHRSNFPPTVLSPKGTGQLLWKLDSRGQ